MTISLSIEIEATEEKVFYWLGDPLRAMKWMTSVKKTEVIEKVEGWVGTTFREYIEENGRGTYMHGVIKEFAPNRRLAFHLEGDYNTADVSFDLVEEEGITRLAQTAEVQSKGVLRLASLAFGSAFKKKIVDQAREEFEGLKELCENG